MRPAASELLCTHFRAGNLGKLSVPSSCWLVTYCLPTTHCRCFALLAAARCSRRHSVCLPVCLSDSYSLPQWSAKTTKQNKAAIKDRVSTVVQSITASRIKGLRCRTGSVTIQVGITHSYHTHIHCIHPPIPAGVLLLAWLCCLCVCCLLTACICCCYCWSPVQSADSAAGVGFGFVARPFSS